MKRARPVKKVTASKKQKLAPKTETAIVPHSLKLKPELKAVDTNTLLTIGTGGASAGHVILMNGLSLGTDRCNRIGRKIQVTSIYTRFQVTATAAALPEDLLVMVVQDKDVEAALPVLQDVMQTTTRTGSVNSDVASFVNLNTTGRFRVLRRTLIPLRVSNATGGAGNYNQDNLVWEWYIPTNILVQYNAGNAGSVADIENNALYVMAFSNSAVGGSTVNVTTRLRYYD